MAAAIIGDIFIHKLGVCSAEDLGGSLPVGGLN